MKQASRNPFARFASFVVKFCTTVWPFAIPKPAPSAVEQRKDLFQPVYRTIAYAGQRGVRPALP